MMYFHPMKEVMMMKKLDAKRREGTTASGYIRSLLERELNQPSHKGQKGR
jgi:hypothetical protein